MLVLDAQGNFVEQSDPNSLSPPATAYTKMYDYDGSGFLLYEGWALSANHPATSGAVWAIRKNTADATPAVTGQFWADGNSDMDNIWDNRTSLTYY